MVNNNDTSYNPTATFSMLRNAFTEVQANELSNNLGVSLESLRALGVGWLEGKSCWVFPERDTAGGIVGLNRRYRDGMQRMMLGHKRGLTYKHPLPHNGLILVVEGASDVLAAMDLGFTAVGRPSATGGFEMLKSLLRNRDVVIVGERDRGIGIKSANKLRAELIDHARSVKMILPPFGCKDLRSSLNAGAKKEDIDKAIEDEVDHVEIEQIIESMNCNMKKTNEPTTHKNETNASRIKYESYPVEVLPIVLRRYVESVAKAMHTEPVCVALAAWSVCATAIGTSRGIQVKRDWIECPLMWATVVAEQGSGKSPPMREALRPLAKRQRQEFDRHHEAMQLHESELAEHQRKVKKFKGANPDEAPVKPQPPACVRLLISDATLEGLCPILSENPRGVLLDGDELVTWFSSFDRYTQASQGDAASWRRIFDGHSITVDRKTGREVIHVPRPFVSIIGTIQPEILRRTLGNEHQESGLAARWLLAYPPKRAVRWSEDDIPEDVKTEYENLIDKLLDLKAEIDEDGYPQPRLLMFTESARNRFIKWHDVHRDEQKQLTGVLSGHWSKLVAYCARFALLIQIVKFESGESQTEAIDDASLTAAITLVNWHKNEARRVYEMLTEDGEYQEKLKLINQIDRRGGRVSTREWQQLRKHTTSKKAEAELGGLVEAELGYWETINAGANGGRPSKQFVVNPQPQQTLENASLKTSSMKHDNKTPIGTS